MAINSYFFNALKDGLGNYDRLYNAEDMTGYLNLLVGNGVFPNPSTQLQVRSGGGMGVIVAAGSGWINGHKMDNTADLTLTIDPSDVLLNRIDRVIFYLDFAARAMGIDVLKGTAAASPTAPALTRTTSRYEMCLAEIAIDKQITAITNAAITDTRQNSDVCGIVSGLIQQLDTSSLYQQMYAWQDQQKTNFQNFMDDITGDLTVDTYIREFTKNVTISTGDSKIVALDMSGYEYNANDVIFVIINGLVGTNVTDYLLDTRDLSNVEVHLNVAGNDDEISIRVLKSLIGWSEHATP